jgi:HECT-domain (ubiquitin-transferase)
VLPSDLLSVFDYQELELLMCGVPELDIEDWKRHTEYQGNAQPASSSLMNSELLDPTPLPGEYARQGSKHKVIKWFWKAVDAMNAEERVRLLQVPVDLSTHLVRTLTLDVVHHRL